MSDDIQHGSEEPDRDSKIMGALLLAIIFGTIASTWYCSTRVSPEDAAEEQRRVKRQARLHGRGVKGTFASSNPALGVWTLEPSGCLSGFERGFEGVVFTFPNGSPVEEIRLDNARTGDNVVEVRLADRGGTVYRVRERECESITGQVDVQNIHVNGQPMRDISGAIAFACAKEGLRGQALFDGCLP